MGYIKRQPNYLQAKDLLLELIRMEKYQVGEVIPSVNKLAQQLGVGRISIQRAVKILAAEGILNSIPGSGCYIKNLPEQSTVKDNTVNDIWDYLAGPGGNTAPKKLRIGYLPELPEHVILWEKIFADYSAYNKDIHIELVKLDFPALLFDQRRLAGIDIFQVPAFLLPFFAQSGFLFDLTELGGLELSPDAFYEGFLKSASFNGNICGVPVVAAGICQYYNKKYESIVKELFPVEGFWDYMEKLEALSRRLKFKDFESLIANAESLFTLAMLTNVNDPPSYDDMKSFNSSEFVEFIKRFEPYFTNERIFNSGIDFYSPAALSSFLDGKNLILMGNTCWLPQIIEKCRFEVGIMPQVIEKSGTRQIAANINVISSSTAYPEECLTVLGYLAELGTQRILAKNGRPVACMDANDLLEVKGFEKDSVIQVIQSFKNGKVIQSSDPYIEEYIRTIMNPEMQKWQKKKISYEELLASLRRKKDFFYRSKSGLITENKARIAI